MKIKRVSSNVLNIYGDDIINQELVDYICNRLKCIGNIRKNPLRIRIECDETKKCVYRILEEYKNSKKKRCKEHDNVLPCFECNDDFIEKRELSKLLD